MQEKSKKALWHAGVCVVWLGAMGACSETEPAAGIETDAAPESDAGVGSDATPGTDATTPTDAGQRDASDAADTDADPNPVDAAEDAAADAGSDDASTDAGDIEPCAPNPCENGGVCTEELDSYACACAPTYAGPQCASCAAGRDDCNGVAADGCEALLSSDRNHCGACGNVCAAGTVCSGGTCQLVEPPQLAGPFDAVADRGPMAPVVADFDNDGKLDVLVANAESGSAATPSGSLSSFRGNGDGTLQAQVVSAGAPLSSNAVVAVDVNGDGWLDAVTVDGQTNVPATHGSISVYLNAANAPGTFTYAASYTTGAPGSLHLCVGDFDGDGHLDVATTSVTSNQVSVLRGAADGSFAAPQLVAIPSTGGVQSSIACRDLTGDGRPEIVVTSPSSARLSVLVNQGDGSFAAPVSYTNAVNGQTAGVAIADADGDGRLDLLSNGAAGVYLFFFKGNGDGTFANGVQSATGQSAIANSALGLAAHDFNGDGKLDVYVLRTTAAGGVWPMIGSGTGVFTAGPLVPVGASPALNALSVADMNGNGYADLVVTVKGASLLRILPNAL